MIGVIGGNGVAATNKLCAIIEERLTMEGAFRDCQHPEMLIWQATQAPSRSMYLEGRGPSFIEDYIRIGKKMKDCGVTHLCMCCNTAHYYLNEIENKIGVPFINIVKETIKVSLPLGRKMGIICSDGAKKVQLYDEWLKTIDISAEIVYPDEDFQYKVTEGICNAKNKIRFDLDNVFNPTMLFTEIEEHLRMKGADVVIGGCTDILNVYKSTSGLPYVDSLEVLADCIIHIIKNERN